MAQVTRMFANSAKAAQVADMLKQAGFSEALITLVEPPPDAADDKAGSVAGSLGALGVSGAFTTQAVPLIAGGAAAVSVAAPFGWAGRAEAILAEAEPLPIDAPDMDPPTRQSTMRRLNGPGSAAEQTGASHGMKMMLRADPPPAGTVEIEHDPTPLSRKLGWPVLMHGAAGGDADLVDEPAPLSAKFGWSVLSPKQPSVQLLPDGWFLSSWFGFRLLSDRQGPATGTMELSDDPAPLSKKFGWRTLLDDPTPLSTKAGWRTVINDPAPLSRILGLKVLSDDPAPGSRAAAVAAPVPRNEVVSLEPPETEVAKHHVVGEHGAAAHAVGGDGAAEDGIEPGVRPATRTRRAKPAGIGESAPSKDSGEVEEA